MNRTRYLIPSLIVIVIVAAILALMPGLIKPRTPRAVLTKRTSGVLSFSGTVAKTFDKPMALTFGKGRLFVADGLRARITALNEDGDFLYAFNSRPNNAKHGKGYPTGLAIGPGGRLYIADLRNEDVWAFSLEGRFLWSLKSRGANFGRPGTVAFARGKLYVSDLSDQTIKAFDPSGKLLAVYGGPGRAPGRFAYVTGIAVDRGGRIYAADSYNARVQVLTSEGVFIKMLAPPAGAKLALPKALALDGAGRVYVIDAFQKKGLVFNAAGRYIDSFSAKEGTFPMPNGVAVDKGRRRVYVIDKLMGTISIWRLPT